LFAAPFFYVFYIISSKISFDRQDALGYCIVAMKLGRTATLDCFSYDLFHLRQDRIENHLREFQ